MEIEGGTQPCSAGKNGSVLLISPSAMICQVRFAQFRVHIQILLHHRDAEYAEIYHFKLFPPRPPRLRGAISGFRVNAETVNFKLEGAVCCQQTQGKRCASMGAHIGSRKETEMTGETCGTLLAGA